MPPDNHVHSEWSWDAIAGNMEQTCARAVEIGLPALAFTEHVDFVPYLFEPEVLPALPQAFLRHMGGGTVLRHPEIDVDGYLASIERCRERFPTLRILSGVEISEPHWHPDAVARLAARHPFERILASVHSRRDGDGARLMDVYFWTEPAAQVMGAYLDEVRQMIEGSSVFQVLAHIDYPVRHWHKSGSEFVPAQFEAEYRAVLRALKQTGRVLEVNTRVPLPPVIVRWWYEEGGDAVSFASDAHLPDRLALGFEAAAAMVEAQGFRAGADPYDFWRRGLTR
ncbi:MAG: PHP domain-containing protein [Chloroflexi bacterium]|nr:PHP domain-containing protein [Chloroflexota bacterium]